MKSRIPLLLALLPFVASCLEVDMREKEELLSTDSNEIVVPSDRVGGRHLVSDTLYVSSNRTWTTFFEGEPDWVTVGTDGHKNMSCISDVMPVVLNFKDNESDEPRSAVLRFFSGKESREVRITQSPIAYRVAVEAPEQDLTSLPCDKDTLVFHMETNTSWVVSMAPGSTMKVQIDSMNGKYSSDVRIIVLDNQDRSAKKNGTLVFKAKECEPVEFNMTQMEGVPYLSLLSDSLYVAIPGINNATFELKTNVDYTCEIDECVGFNQSSVKLPAGKSTDISTTIQFAYCYDFSVTEGRLRIKVSSPEVEKPIYLTIVQMPVLRMLFGSLDKIYLSSGVIDLVESIWPFASPTFKKVPNSKSNAISKATPYELELINGYKLTAYSVAGFWKNSSTGFGMGGKVGDWLQFPAVEGHRLAMVEYCYKGNTPITFTVTDPEGNVLVKEATTGTNGSVTMIEMNNSEPGKAYRIVSLNNITFSIGDIVMYYE